MFDFKLFPFPAWLQECTTTLCELLWDFDWVPSCVATTHAKIVGQVLDHLTAHGISRRKSEGRHYHHGAINGIIHRALNATCIPSRLEPSGLDHTDGKRPDGVTIILWKNGKPLVQDVICPDNLAQSYSCHVTMLKL